jgi:hypothetical protein
MLDRLYCGINVLHSEGAQHRYSTIPQKIFAYYKSVTSESRLHYVPLRMHTLVPDSTAQTRSNTITYCNQDTQKETWCRSFGLVGNRKQRWDSGYV